jgi:MFS family permease
MQITFGVLTRFARRFQILGVGNALAFIGTIFMALSQNFGHLVIGRAFRALGTCTYHPVGGAIMAASFPNDRAKALGLYDTAGNIGSLVAPLLVGGLLHVMGWRSVLFILGAPFIITSILCFSVKETVEPVPIETKKRDRFGLQEYKAVFKDRNALILSLTMMAGAGGRGGGVIQTYLTVLLVDRFGISVSLAALLFAAFTLGGMFGPLVMGWFSDRTSPLLATRLNLIFSSLSIVSILAPAVPGILLAVFIFLSGFFIGSRNTLLQTLLIQCGAQDARIDTQLSLYYTIGAISGPFWTILVGVLVDQFGMDTAIWTMSVSYVVSMIILSFIRLDQSPDKNKEASEN